MPTICAHGSELNLPTCWILRVTSGLRIESGVVICTRDCSFLTRGSVELEAATKAEAYFGLG